MNDSVTKITKEQFTKNYARRCKMTLEELKKIRIAVPCNCDYEECRGWQMINPKDIDCQ